MAEFKMAEFKMAEMQTQSKKLLIRCSNCKNRHFQGMNCGLSRVCNLINYLPYIGTFKSFIEMIISMADGESDEIAEMVIAFIIGFLTDIYTFGVFNGAVQGSFKCGEVFAMSWKEVAKKIVEGMSGEAIKKLAETSFIEAMEGVMLTSTKEITTLGSEFVAKNATKIAAQNLLTKQMAKSVLTKTVAINTLTCISKGEGKVETCVRAIWNCFGYNL